MSRYLLLALLNAPLIMLALIGLLVNYKMSKVSRKKYIVQTILWIAIFVGLASSKYVYEYLFSNNLTHTEPLSLFDVVEITGIVAVLFMSNRSRIKADTLERRLNDLHQELSIRLSEDEPTSKK